MRRQMRRYLEKGLETTGWSGLRTQKLNRRWITKLEGGCTQRSWISVGIAKLDADAHGGARSAWVLRNQMRTRAEELVRCQISKLETAYVRRNLICVGLRNLFRSGQICVTEDNMRQICKSNPRAHTRRLIRARGKDLWRRV